MDISLFCEQHHTGPFEFKSGKNSTPNYGQIGQKSVLKNHFLEKNYMLRTPADPKNVFRVKSEGCFYILDPK